MKWSLETSSRLFSGISQLDFEGYWGRNFQHSGFYNRHTTQYGGKASLFVFLGNKWEVYSKADLNKTEVMPSQYASAFFLDAGIRLKLPKWEWELKGQNLTNVREYVVRNYRDADTFTSYYTLRPIESLLSVKMKF